MVLQISIFETLLTEPAALLLITAFYFHSYGAVNSSILVSLKSQRSLLVFSLGCLSDLTPKFSNEMLTLYFKSYKKMSPIKNGWTSRKFEASSLISKADLKQCWLRSKAALLVNFGAFYNTQLVSCIVENYNHNYLVESIHSI